MLLRYGYRESDFNSGEIRAHIAQCQRCREDLALERLAAVLIKAHRSLTPDTDPGVNPYLMTRIRARIRELGEQGVNSWESAILTLRGWLIAFGAAAVLLFSLSMQWQLSNATAANDQDNEQTALSIISEDFISGNAGAVGKSSDTPNPQDEAVGNAHK
jgi:hypothetical protein